MPNVRLIKRRGWRRLFDRLRPLADVMSDRMTDLSAAESSVPPRKFVRYEIAYLVALAIRRLTVEDAEESALRVLGAVTP